MADTGFHSLKSGHHGPMVADRRPVVGAKAGQPDLPPGDTGGRDAAEDFSVID